jgi:hypothetical protein
VFSGATDGSIAFWDLTGAVEAFMQRLSTLKVENFIDCQRRPRTGRGSQGGRWWRSLSSSLSKRRPGSGSVTAKAGDGTNHNMLNHVTNGAELLINDSESSPAACSNAIRTASVKSEVNIDEYSPDICEIRPLHVLNNVHQSGVNCLHVSDIRDCQSPPSGFLFNIISGGDDQALNYLRFEISPIAKVVGNDFMTPSIRSSFSGLERIRNLVTHGENKNENFSIEFLYHEKIASAHSSAIKGKPMIS